MLPAIYLGLIVGMWSCRDRPTVPGPGSDFEYQAAKLAFLFSRCLLCPTEMEWKYRILLEFYWKICLSIFPSFLMYVFVHQKWNEMSKVFLETPEELMVGGTCYIIDYQLLSSNSKVQRGPGGGYKS